MGKRCTRAAIRLGDIVQTPANLGIRIRLPICAGRSHFGTWQCLGDSICSGRGISGLVVPARFMGPERVQATKLTRTPAMSCHLLRGITFDPATGVAWCRASLLCGSSLSGLSLSLGYGRRLCSGGCNLPFMQPLCRAQRLPYLPKELGRDCLP
jgi:hypothetical protein